MTKKQRHCRARCHASHEFSARALFSVDRSSSRQRSDRRTTRVATVLMAVLLVAVVGCDVPDEGAESVHELIPLERLMAPASYTAPLLSPDGRFLVWVAPHEGVPNFFVAETEDPGAARPLTRFTDSGVRATDVSGQIMYRWHVDSKHLLFPKDYGGDENFDLYMAAVESGEVRNLTPIPEKRVSLAAYGRERPNEALVAVETFGQLDPEIYLLNFATGELELVQSNPDPEAGGFIAFLGDSSLSVRLGLRFSATGGLELMARRDGSWEVLYSVAEEDLPAFSSASAQNAIQLSSDGEHLFLYDAKERDKAALVSLDLETGDVAVLASDERVDVGGVLFHPRKNTPEAYALNWTSTRWTPLDESLAADFFALDGLAEGDWQVVSRSDADDLWVVQHMASDSPVVFHLYQRETKQATRLFVATPQLEGLELSPMHPFVLTTDDGFDLVSYVTLPPWTDSDDDGRPNEPLPTVVFVHGGPSDERAQLGFGPLVHWLANRGYAFLFVNFRGSAGFGKAYMNAQRNEWGGRMHQDVLDQVEWAVAEGIADSERVAILGGSYGGYEALVGMTMTPDVFACGVDIVGPSNLEIFMPHWDPDRMGKVIGDPRTEEGRELLRSRSPINFAHQTRSPVLIGQGANDSRVPKEQSDTVVDRMHEAGAEVTYVVFPDEGHGFARPANSMAFFAVTEVFLGQCLGGRYEPLRELGESTMLVPVGAEWIDGLNEALQ